MGTKGCLIAAAYSAPANANFIENYELQAYKLYLYIRQQGNSTAHKQETHLPTFPGLDSFHNNSG